MKKLYIMNEGQISNEPVRAEREYTKEGYIPKKQEILRDYEINIRFLSVGCVVRVGCKEIPFRRVSEAMEELNKYVENPYEETKKWNIVFYSE